MDGLRRSIEEAKRMSPTNGESKIRAKDLTFSDRLDIIIQALGELAAEVQEIKETQTELIEKVGNLTLESDGYGFEKYGES